MCDELII